MQEKNHHLCAVLETLLLQYIILTFTQHLQSNSIAIVEERVEGDQLLFG